MPLIPLPVEVEKDRTGWRSRVPSAEENDGRLSCLELGVAKRNDRKRKGRDQKKMRSRKSGDR